MKKVLAWEDVRIQSICASLYAQEGKIANPDDVTSQSNLASSAISAIIAEQIAMIACMSAVMVSTTTSI